MKKFLLKKYNRPLIYSDCNQESLKSDEIKIHTAYAGVSFTDLIIQKGLYKYQKENLPLPYTPGFEASGVVIEVGSSVKGFKNGDKVVVIQRDGCLAEEIVAKEANVIKLPSDISMSLAASLPVNFFTAFHALNNIVKIFPESDLLVTNASGGVGGLLVQLAAAQGHRVTGLVRSETNIPYVADLGAKEVFPYREFLQTKRKFDVIFDASAEGIGNKLSLLKKNGKLLLYGFHSLVPGNNKNPIAILHRFIHLPKIKLFDLVYQNRTISGFNIIHLDTDTVEFTAAKTEFTKLAEQGKLPNKHQVRILSPEEFSGDTGRLFGGQKIGKVVISFNPK